MEHALHGDLDDASAKANGAGAVQLVAAEAHEEGKPAVEARERSHKKDGKDPPLETQRAPEDGRVSQ